MFLAFFVVVLLLLLGGSASSDESDSSNVVDNDDNDDVTIDDDDDVDRDDCESGESTSCRKGRSLSGQDESARTKPGMEGDRIKPLRIVSSWSSLVLAGLLSSTGSVVSLGGSSSSCSQLALPVMPGMKNRLELVAFPLVRCVCIMVDRQL